MARVSTAIYAGAPDGSTTMASNTTSPTSGNVPASIIQLLLVLNYCIALIGIFPSRN
jgi:microcystin-dependent protein